MSNLIIDIDGIDFVKANITYVDGLTIENVRLKYSWLLNAKVKDVVIGEDDYGLVWYSGDWFCGEWINGTWYSGNFHKGNWNNGRWYSYKLNKYDLINNKFIIEERGPQYSHFINGLWLNGIWNDGIFGLDVEERWEGQELYTYLNTDYIDTEVPNFRVWKETWDSSIGIGLNYDNMISTGFYTRPREDKGYFDIGETVLLEDFEEWSGYHDIYDIWYDTNGDIGALYLKNQNKEQKEQFEIYYNDFITQTAITYFSKKDLGDKYFLSKIYDTKHTFTDTYLAKNVATWMSGEWNHGIFQDAIWKDGIWKNGDFNNSKWLNGNWYDGIFNGDTWYNGNWYNGDFIKGKWMNGVFTKLNKTNISRFGAVQENVMTTICEWYDGEWKNGDWFSGYHLINDTEFSYNNKISIWYAGVWRNGTWYGGHFKSGKWYNGLWKEGIYGNLIKSDYYKSKYVTEYVDETDYDFINFTDNSEYFNNDGINNLGSYWSGDTGLLKNSIELEITPGDISENTTTSYELQYMECQYETQIGGWSNAPINTTGITSANTYSGVNDTEITIYIRDAFTKHDYDNYNHELSKLVNNEYIPRLTPKKSNFVYELSQTNIMTIGGTGYTISAVTYISGGTQNDIIYDVGITPSTKKITTKGYTKILLKEKGLGVYNTLIDTYNLNSGLTVNIYNKEPIIYKNGNGGENRTYLEFEKIISKNGKMTFLCINKPSIIYPIDCLPPTTNPTQINEASYKEIYVDISDSSTITDYLKGYNLVIDIKQETNPRNKYYRYYYVITTRSAQANLENVSGKIIELFTYRNREQFSKPKNIIFQDFIINNIDSDRIVTGIKVKVNNQNVGDIGKVKCNTLSLPLKQLIFKELDPNSGYVNLIYNSKDKPSYDPYYFGSYGNYSVNGVKNIDSEILVGDNEYGSNNDLWGLEELIKYYPDNNTIVPEIIQSDYDVTTIDSIRDNLRVMIDYSIKDSIDNSINLSDVELVVYYTDSDNRCVWYNGTFEKGLWLNGKFESGKIESVLMFTSTFNNGTIGYEKNSKRQINPKTILKNITPPSHY